MKFETFKQFYELFQFDNRPLCNFLWLGLMLGNMTDRILEEFIKDIRLGPQLIILHELVNHPSQNIAEAQKYFSRKFYQIRNIKEYVTLFAKYNIHHVGHHTAQVEFLDPLTGSTIHANSIIFTLATPKNPLNPDRPVIH